jgi:hypothetical protein
VMVRLFSQVRAIMLGAGESPAYSSEAGGGQRDTSKYFVPNSLFGFGRLQLLNGLRLSKVR